MMSRHPNQKSLFYEELRARTHEAQLKGAITRDERAELVAAFTKSDFTKAIHDACVAIADAGFMYVDFCLRMPTPDTTMYTLIMRPNDVVAAQTFDVSWLRRDLFEKALRSEIVRIFIFNALSECVGGLVFISNIDTYQEELVSLRFSTMWADAVLQDYTTTYSDRFDRLEEMIELLPPVQGGAHYLAAQSRYTAEVARSETSGSGEIAQKQ